VLYTVMGLASREVWKHTGLGGLPLSLYAAQLALNFAWSPLFFVKKEIGLALADITGAAPAQPPSVHNVCSRSVKSTDACCTELQPHDIHVAAQYRTMQTC
jgi:hypothetical protein